MPTEDTTTSPSGLDVTKLLAELEVPFSPDQVRWRVTNTTNDKKRGQIVPYADCRAYTDRLNALFTPQGWTREYKVETMTNITRVKKGESIRLRQGAGHLHGHDRWHWVAFRHGGRMGRRRQRHDVSGRASVQKGLLLLWSRPLLLRFQRHLGRSGPESPATENPALFAWALPENWRKGMRPSSRNGDSGSGTPSNGTNGRSQANGSNTPKTSGNGHSKAGSSNGGTNGTHSDDLDVRIAGLEKTVGTPLYRNILRECGRVNQPKLIRDPAVKRSVLQLLESAARGFTRLEAVTKRLEPKTIEALLAKLQAPPLAEISDMKTLQHVVFGLEELAGPDQHHAA